jgi:hypothetical protein
MSHRKAARERLCLNLALAKLRLKQAEAHASHVFMARLAREHPELVDVGQGKGWKLKTFSFKKLPGCSIKGTEKNLRARKLMTAENLANTQLPTVEDLLQVDEELQLEPFTGDEQIPVYPSYYVPDNRPPEEFDT